VCRHIEQYYRPVIDRCPFAFWILSVDDLRSHFGDSFDIESEPSKTGDDCHRNIIGIPDGRAQSWSKSNCKPPHVFLCSGDECIQLTKDQFESLHEMLTIA
jgi:hypothetical protein